MYSVLIPLLFYPFILWLLVTTLTFLQGQQERLQPRLGYRPHLTQGLQAGFIHALEKSGKFLVFPITASEDPRLSYDAYLDTNPTASPDHLILSFRGDTSLGQEASRRVQDIFKKLQHDRRSLWLKKHKLSAEILEPFHIKSTSISESSDVGGYLLGSLLPIGLLIMTALGGAYPAVDTTAGERERGTWETLQSCGPSITAIVLSKYLFVSLMCCLSGLLNMTAMLISIRSILAPMLRQHQDVSFEVSPSTLAVLVLGVVFISLFLGAALLLCAIFARTFREGQALVTPMFMLIALPLLPLSNPSQQLTATTSLIPLVNLALIWREALQGSFRFLYLAQTTLSLSIVIALFLALGSHILKNETLMSDRGIEPTLQGILTALRKPKS